MEQKIIYISIIFKIIVIGDLWPEEDREKEAEPEWVKSEKEQFKDYRDKNKDGKMDKEEVSAWILPPDYDHVDSEAKHLIAESDTNNVRH